MGHPVQLWRICRARYAQTAFSGEGSVLYDGRWNFEGVRMVYAATSLSLAAIETFVHLDPNEEPADLVSTSAILSATIEIETLDTHTLPANWNELDQSSTRIIGSAWVQSGRSVALKVPSVVVRGDWNVLLNPAHSDFSKITLLSAEPWHFDARMFRRTTP